MITGWTIYWIGILDNLIIMFRVLGIITMVLLGIFTFIGCMMLDIHDTNWFKKAKLWIVLAMIYAVSNFFACCLTPSSKHAAAILLIPPVVNGVMNNEQIKQLPDNIATLTNDWIKALSPKETESK